ncbi:MAG: hypothetical protein MZU97_04880 [Bacillus subtilis]|nr:hypothetical protein [Bacillus subtilis]
MLVGGGGLVSYLGTSNGVRDRQSASKKATRSPSSILQAMAYQIAKEIGSLYFVAKGDIDAILITGGLAYNKPLVEMLKERINPILPLDVLSRRR